jgi:hypothetical protein
VFKPEIRARFIKAREPVSAENPELASEEDSQKTKLGFAKEESPASPADRAREKENLTRRLGSQRFKRSLGDGLGLLAKFGNSGGFP